MLDSPLVIAVVDDDPAIRQLVAAIVRASGDVVIEAGTFAEAELLLREYPWDVAVIDRRLPGGDGLELCRQVAAGAGTDSHRHVVFLSAVDSPEERLRGFEAGADEYIGKPADPAEFRARLRAIRRTVVTQKELLARLATLEQLSVIDGLTQVYNHRFFKSELRRQFDLTTRHERPLAMAMIDLDLFKAVNDSYGHQVGDVVLTEISTAIAQNIRSTDVLARYGGEEFGILMPESTLADAAAIAERVRGNVEALIVAGAFGQVRMTVSIGVAAVPSPGIDTAAQLIEAADKALYFAKERGRNRVTLHGLAGYVGPESVVVPYKRLTS
jgi:two-component system, cell cycle response regulator